MPRIISRQYVSSKTHLKTSPTTYLLPPWTQTTFLIEEMGKCSVKKIKDHIQFFSPSRTNELEPWLLRAGCLFHSFTLLFWGWGWRKKQANKKTLKWITIDLNKLLMFLGTKEVLGWRVPMWLWLSATKRQGLASAFSGTGEQMKLIK